MINKIKIITMIFIVLHLLFFKTINQTITHGVVLFLILSIQSPKDDPNNNMLATTMKL